MVTNTLAYYIAELFTTVKGLITQRESPYILANYRHQDKHSILLNCRINCDSKEFNGTETEIMTNTLAYNIAESIMTAKSLMAQKQLVHFGKF
jgi:hypothetical protein